MTSRPPSSTLFPYTTLFRSHRLEAADRNALRRGRRHRRRPSVMEYLVRPEPAAEPQWRRAASRDRRVRAIERLRRHDRTRSEEHTSELQSRQYLVCRLLLEK